MKKVKYILYFIILVLCMTACSQDFGKHDNSKQSEQESYVQQQHELQPKEQEQEEPVRIERATITAVGDIMMHNTQIWAGYDKQNDSYNFDHFFTEIKEHINSADLAIGNLETTLAGKEKEYTGYPMFNAPEQLADTLSKTGFDIITTANNHSLDRGEYGVIKTIENLDKAGLKHTGTYRGAEEYNDLLITDVNGIKISVLAYTYGTNGIPLKKPYLVNLIDMQKIKKDVDKAKSMQSDLIIACMHFGQEYQRHPNDEQKQIVNQLFDMGVDIVLGSHPHVLQPMELREITDTSGLSRKVFVIYSLGNFISAQTKQYRDSGIILNIQVQKNFKSNTTDIIMVDYIPTWVDVYKDDKGITNYRVVAVEKAIKDFESRKDRLLSEDDYKRLQAVWEESTQHMNNAEQKIVAKNIE